MPIAVINDLQHLLVDLNLQINASVPRGSLTWDVGRGGDGADPATKDDDRTKKPRG
jgi:hypothetical protein